MKAKFVLFTAIFASMISPLFCQASENIQSSTEKQLGFFSFNRHVVIRSFGTNIESANEAAQTRFQQLDKIFNPKNSESELYKINNSSGKTVRVSTEMAEMLKFAIEMHELTEGAYNPLMKRLNWQWNIDGSRGSYGSLPSAEKIAELLALTDMNKIKFDGVNLTLPKGVELDFGDTALFYAADEAIKLMKIFRVTGCSIDINGNQVVYGKNAGTSERWNFLITSPFYSKFRRSIKFSEGCAHTTQRLYVVNNRQKISSIIDPRTGYPSKSNVASASVITASGKYGAALSQAASILGYEKTKELQTSRKDFEFVIIEGESAESAFRTSPGLSIDYSRHFGMTKVGEHPVFERTPKGAEFLDIDE